MVIVAVFGFDPLIEALFKYQHPQSVRRFDILGRYRVMRAAHHVYAHGFLADPPVNRRLVRFHSERAQITVFAHTVNPCVFSIDKQASKRVVFTVRFIKRTRF